MAIKILHLISGLPPGGAEICLKGLVENNPDPQIQQWVYPLRNRPKEITISGNIIRRNYFNYDPRKLLTIIKFCRQHKIDIIHGHLVKGNLAALLAKPFTNARLIVHEHGSIFHKGQDDILYRMGLRMLKSQVDIFLPVSDCCRQHLIDSVGTKPEKIEVLHNAIDLQRFNPGNYDSIAIRKEYGFEADDIVLGFVGRLVPLKGADLLLPAFSDLLKKYSRLKLLLIGDGALRDTINHQIADLGLTNKVVLAGHLENVAPAIAAFDMAIVPSREESFGIAALECMAMARPLVCSDVFGLAELATDGENAIVCQPDSASIAAVVDKLLNNPQLATTIAQNARQFAQQFSLQNQINKLTNLYYQLMQSK